MNPPATLRALALAPARLAYGLWSALAFLGVGLTALLLLAVLTALARRRAAARADARRVLRNASNGHSLVFFPEGTFTRTPGLLTFHTGAFATALRAGCPVVPAVVRGTRRALPPNRGLPLPGPLELQFLAPLARLPDTAAELRDRARAAILEALGEPDLTCCGDTARPPGTARARSARAS